MADQPMKALTIWQPWASLILWGFKPMEFRGWRAPRFLAGQRIVIHAGSEPPRKGVRDLLLNDDRLLGTCGHGFDLATVRAALERVAEGGYQMECGAGLGTAVLGRPEPADLYYRRMGWPAPSGPLSFAWPLSDIEAWDTPVPMRGAQGLWNWPIGAADHG